MYTARGFPASELNYRSDENEDKLFVLCRLIWSELYVIPLSTPKRRPRLPGACNWKMPNAVLKSIKFFMLP